MIDEQGFRSNVGIILLNKYQEVFWAGRIGQPAAWQFPQGGVNENETPEEALYRELYEEVGLLPEHVRLLGKTKSWLRYRLPKKYLRRDTKPLCIGQKQIWFLLELLADESDIQFNLTKSPEFDRWTWVEYWHPVENVIPFKRRVYQRALTEFKTIVFGTHNAC
jgi:putative (di)nucleoside polyphosphate hydrolase